ncbi:DUF2231 domain-containing protein [Bradyrhizobium sp.]|uniref:DUF2231 domain-containing protein n=1 Tax=Bradyrhizobium sp. TaxID=376 RepID=UPI002D65BB94|nr:DUF2231 domain-containing protein [Bradyrhizobium sp.]HZR75255.1 DUF2231 domain-containing protein [Bradyrhizobium sp.]
MRFLGHPVHPMLVHFPIVLWTIAVIAYVANAAGMIEAADEIAEYSNGAGLIMALLAMTAGGFELRTIDSRSEAMRVATSHMMFMAVVWFCFLAALLLQVSPGRSASPLVVASCAIAGFLLMIAGARLGGRLVYDFGVAVKSQSKP